ncbi:MAG: hypothetical protein QF614_04305 [SAR324 cluster bacterium]|nr:hypothetical protein [SAR324 cluster bacterium]MDP7463695.1 hypothetical protein [SAR324 cluster bacterium]|tara:strand:- start:325 stop:525 length:201 start_codon:yes stop_codon:yes gene_type:complete
MSKGECALPEVLAQTFPKVFILPALLVRGTTPHQWQTLQGKVDKTPNHESEDSPQENALPQIHATS